MAGHKANQADPTPIEEGLGEGVVADAVSDLEERSPVTQRIVELSSLTAAGHESSCVMVTWSSTTALAGTEGLGGTTGLPVTCAGSSSWRGTAMSPSTHSRGAAR